MATHVLINDFTPTDPRTLPGKKGEEFTVVSETSGWCTCTNATGKTGLLPSAYLKPLPASQSMSGDEYVEALHDYANPQDPRVIPFKAKDVMKVIKKVPGWWTCEIVSTGKTGMVPQTYLKPCPAPSGGGSGGGSASPGPAPVAVPDTSESEAAAKEKPINPVAAAAAAVAARKKSAATAPTTTPLIPSPSAVIAPAPISAPTSLASVSTPKPKSPSPAIGDDGKTASSTAASKGEVKASGSAGGGDTVKLKASPSSPVLELKSVGSDDITLLLATFNKLQQETNALLQQQMEELVEIKSTVKHINQTVKDIHTI